MHTANLTFGIIRGAVVVIAHNLAGTKTSRSVHPHRPSIMVPLDLPLAPIPTQLPTQVLTPAMLFFPHPSSSLAALSPPVPN